MPVSRAKLHFYALLGAVGVLFWVALLVAGSTMDAETVKKQLTAQFTFGQFGLYCLLYLPANAAILTCLAGFVGGISSWLTLHGGIGQPNVFRTEHPFASMLRSFVVYLIFIAGIAVSAPENPFVDIKPGQYLRVAGLLSVLGFIVGYDPGVFRKLLDRIPGTNQGWGPGRGQGG